MAVRDLAATALRHLLSAGDAPGGGPGPLETLFGLPGMPPGLKPFGRLLDNPDHKFSDDEAIELIGDMAPLPIGPAKETIQEGTKNTREYTRRKNDIIDSYNREARKGVEGQGK